MMRSLSEERHSTGVSGMGEKGLGRLMVGILNGQGGVSVGANLMLPIKVVLYGEVS